MSETDKSPQGSARDSTLPSGTLGMLVHDVARLLRKRFEQGARARRLGLTRSQAAVLIHLERHEGINQVTLAQMMELEPITLVRLLDRLQAAGLVERRADAADRRARILYLTAEARPLLQRIWSLAEEVRDEATAGLSDAERDALSASLLAIKTNLLDLLSEPAAEMPALPEKEVIHG